MEALETCFNSNCFFIAQHCIIKERLDNILVVLGEHNFKVPGDGEEYFPVKKFIHVRSLWCKFCFFLQTSIMKQQ